MVAVEVFSATLHEAQLLVMVIRVPNVVEHTV